MAGWQRIYKARKSSSETSAIPVDGNELLARWGLGIVIGNVLLVLISTLFPFDFSFSNHLATQAINERRYLQWGDLSDWLNNILLFIPFGLGLACFMQKRGLESIALLVTVLMASFSLSLAMEVLQVFLPSRVSSLADLAANGIGGGLGFVCFSLWKTKILGCILTLVERSQEYFSLKKLTVVFISYFALACLSSIALRNTTDLSNWDETFPLLIGNERTGDRPWRGVVSELHIVSRAISPPEVERAFSEESYWSTIGDSLLASYQLTGSGSYPDRTGKLPDLSWQGLTLNAPYRQNRQNGRFSTTKDENYSASQFPDASLHSQDKTGVFISPSYWLETVTPVKLMIRKIRETSQFTLSAIVFTADKSQTGPARIVSLSGNPYQRNFTLGQERSDLIFRLRTPLNNENGTTPELIISDVFADTNFHHIIVTYDGYNFRLYVDTVKNLFPLEMINIALMNSERLLWPYLSSSFGNYFAFNLNLDEKNTSAYKMVFYTLIFVPLGSILGLATITRTGKVGVYMLFVSWIVLPSLTLEGLLVRGIESSMSLENILLGTGITVIAMLLFRFWIVSWLPNKCYKHQLS